MSQPPQVNCDLTQIQGRGVTPNYTRSGTAGPVKWQGVSGAYVQEKIVSAFNANGELNRTMVTKLFMDSELASQAPLQAGDTVTYTFRGQTFTRRVQSFDAAAMPGAPSYTAAILEEASAT